MSAGGMGSVRLGLGVLGAAQFVAGLVLLSFPALAVAAGILAACGLLLLLVLRFRPDSEPENAPDIATEGQDSTAPTSWATLGDGLDIGLTKCDSRGRITYANPAAAKMFGFEDPVGQTLLAVSLSYDLERMVLDVLRTHTPNKAEMTFTFPAEKTAIVKVWPDPVTEEAYVSTEEITELRRLERVRQDFVANVSHELRTPLSTIRAMAETLGDDPGSKDLKISKYPARIMDEVDRLALISNDLLILSSAESNPVQKQVADLAAICRTTVERLEMKARARGLNVKFDGPSRVMVAANIAQISQVVSNLIENAISYTQQGSVSIALTTNDTHVRLIVKDTGIGIPSDQIDRIFERFYRVDQGRARLSGGTGLGLSIVKHIVEAHGGTVSVKSELNVGTEFTVELPLK